MPLWRQVLRWLGTVVMVPIILFEEWGWKPIARLMNAIGRLRLIARLELGLRRANRYWALAFFIVPVVVLFPFKLGALWLIAHQQKLAGFALIIAAKLVSTALLGRLFMLTQKQLMTFAWFARAYRWWRTTKDSVMNRVRASTAWALARQIRDSVTAGVRRWLGR